MVIAGIGLGVFAIAGLAMGLGSSGGDGGSSGGGSSTSYVAPSSSPSSSPSYSDNRSNMPSTSNNNAVQNLSNSNPDHKELASIYLRNEIKRIMPTLKNQWKDDPNPGIPVCRFTNGNGQCQTAATLQSLMNLDVSPVDGNVYNLVEAMKGKANNNAVRIQSFLDDFSTAHFEPLRALDNIEKPLKIFLTGRTEDTIKDRNGLPVTVSKEAGVADSMTALISLLALDQLQDYCLLTYSSMTGDVRTVMSCSTGNRNPAVDWFSLEDMADALFPVYSDYGGLGSEMNKVLNAPKHFTISTEGVIPAELLHMLSHSREEVEHRKNNEMEFSLKDVNNVSHRYRLKSMVCRRTPQTLLTEGNINVINNQSGTHFVSVINTGNKFIKIDSLSPQTIESCPNDHLINFVKTSSGTYLMPVLMMFEKISSAPNGM